MTHEALALALTLSIAAVLLSGALIPESERTRRFEIKDGRIIDRGGRVFVFRGVNAAGNSKASPDHLPFAPEEDLYCNMLRESGFNLVRFFVFWEAIEPEKGVLDCVCIDRVGRLLEKATDRGIYAIVDMHQDIFSRWLGGDGAGLGSPRDRHRSREKRRLRRSVLIFRLHVLAGRETGFRFLLELSGA